MTLDRWSDTRGWMGKLTFRWDVWQMRCSMKRILRLTKKLDAIGERCHERAEH